VGKVVLNIQGIIDWYEAKQQYMEKNWRWGVEWLRTNGFKVG
jgi:hypothetical protein